MKTEKHEVDIVVFGVGGIYRQNKERIAPEDRIVAFLDNDTRMQGKVIKGIEVLPPSRIREITYDKIVLMSQYAAEMRAQLLKLGCRREEMLHYSEYINGQHRGEMKVFFAERRLPSEKKCLILTMPVGYHGGAVAAVYAALAISKRGYEAAVAAPDGDIRFIREFQGRGITFFLYPNLQFARREELFWTEDFGQILVNTYPMLPCALEIGRDREVAVWIHENDIVYPTMEFWRDEIIRLLPLRKPRIYAVSDVARRNFIRNVTEYRIEVLPYGIPDRKKGTKKERKGLTFALIGGIHPVKGQLLYLEAIASLREAYQEKNSFWIIGREVSPDYAKKVEKVSTKQHVKLLGELQRNELERAYQEIDVLVVASMQEAMSLVATEAMMYGKLCIVCNVAGMAEFIEHGVNGLLCKTGDRESLAAQMAYCIEHKDRLVVMGERARETYCQSFTMEKLGERLEQILEKVCTRRIGDVCKVEGMQKSEIFYNGDEIACLK